MRKPLKAPADMTQEELDAAQRESSWAAVCYLIATPHGAPPNVAVATAHAERAAAVQAESYARMIREMKAEGTL